MEKKKSPEPKHWKAHVITEKNIAEQGYDPETNRTYYIVYDRETGEITEEDSVEVGAVTYYPLLHSDITTNQVFLPSKAEEYGTDSELFKGEEEFLDKWHEERNRGERSIDVCYVAVTHIYDVPLPELPYRRRLAPFGKGKSAAGQAMCLTSYTGMLLAGMDTEASLRASFDKWRGTAFVDEGDFGYSDLHSTIMKILNVGFSNLGGWYRSQDPNDATKERVQRVYGPKIIATRQRWKDIALESRCLTAMSYEALRPVPLFRHKQFLKEALHLRNKWLMWRFRNWYRFKDMVETKIEQPGIFEELYGSLNIRGRIRQILVPLGLIASDQLKKDLGAAGLALEETLTSLDEEGALERSIKDEVRLILKENGVSQVSEVSQLLGHPVEGWTFDKDILKVPLRQITIRLIEVPESSKEYDKELKTQGRKVAEILRDRMGVKVKTGRANKSFVWLDRRVLEGLLATNPTNLTNLLDAEGAPHLMMPDCEFYRTAKIFLREWEDKRIQRRPTAGR